MSLVTIKSRIPPRGHRQFIEWTDGATLYRAELDLPSLHWVITSLTKIEGSVLMPAPLCKRCSFHRSAA